MELLTRFFTVFSLWALVTNEALACLKGKGGKEQNPETNPNTDNGNPSRHINDNNALQKMVGDNINTNPYSDEGYKGKNEIANKDEDLNCDFESPCCWKNEKPPYDTMDWLQGSGEPDKEKFQGFFDTTTFPTGNYLIVASDTVAGEQDRADFISCRIPCAASEITVSIKHWQTDFIKLKVCETNGQPPNDLIGCMDLPLESGKSDAPILPPGENLTIVIIATNFVNPLGSVAIIDDIEVQYEPCVSTTMPPETEPPTTPPPPPVTTPPPPPPDDKADAMKVCCTFDSSSCNYNTGTGSSSNNGKSKDWQATKGRFKNPATGVASSPDNAYYATYMKPKENSYTEVQTNFLKKKTIKFQEYKATQDINLKACCNTEQGCTYDTGNNVAKGDFRQWYQASLDCPAGTNKVIFSAENSGNNEGGVGIDNVQVFDENGQRIC